MSASNTDINNQDKVTPFAQLSGWKKSRITRMINTSRYVNRFAKDRKNFDLTPDQVAVLVAYKAGKRITMYHNPKVVQEFDLDFDSFHANGHHEYYIHE